MRRLSIMAVVLTVSGLLVLAQILLKTSTSSLPKDEGARSFVHLAAHLIRTPAFLGALAAGAVAGIFWIALLMGKGADLSLVYPLLSVSYIFAMVASHFFLGEQLSPGRIGGTIIILAGVVVLLWKG